MNPVPANHLLSAPPCLLAGRDDRFAEIEARQWFKAEIHPHEADLRSYLSARFPFLGKDVDDLIQETYIRILRARATHSGEINRQYLFVVARNLGLDLCRRQKRLAFEPLGSSDAPLVVDEKAATPAEIVSHEQELELVREALAQLPPRCAEVVRLFRFEHLPYREIAQKLSISERTVNAQLALGVLRCRRYLAERGVTAAQFDVEHPSTSA